MPAAERIAIVGAGVIGCAVAFELARRGADVVLFEGGEVGSGATQASAGILAPYTEGHPGGPLFALAVRGLEMYEEFVRDVRQHTERAFEFRRAGTIEVAEDAERERELSARGSTPDLEWLDREALRRWEPAVTPRARGGLWCPRHAYVTVRTFVTAIADAAVRCGATISVQTRVDRLDTAPDRIVVHAGGTPRTFDRAVLCAGAWTPELDPLGSLRDRIRPVRGQLLRLRVRGAAPRQILWSRSCYLVPWEDGTVLVGATSEDVGFEVRATAAGVHSLLAAACELVPSLKDATFEDVHVGLRPASVDGLPILGPAPDPRIVYAAGHYRNGILLAPLTARAIANYVFTNTVDPSFGGS